jgi:photosystem II stability/assembly factor-like uncharacterized protein
VEVRTLAFLAVAVMAPAQSWTPQKSGTTASLRGLAAVSDKIGWASGTGGTYLLTVDGGATWTAKQVPGAEALDFRDVHALDAETAWLLSAGPGEKSRIYHTIDGGRSWTLQFTNPDAAGFFDAIAFWDARRGMVLGDPIAGHFAFFVTDDGGDHWRRSPSPAAFPNEGAFAASGTCLIITGRRDAWFATGGARIFHSSDGGATWNATQAPIRHDSPSAGIFSVAMRDTRRGVAVGGDYKKPGEDLHNVAITSDGGRTWTEPGERPAGFRSAVTYVPSLGIWLAVGTSGSDLSRDGGETWKPFDKAAYNAVDFPWAVGPDGAIARFASR